jgi:hypothetical protein
MNVRQGRGSAGAALLLSLTTIAACSQQPAAPAIPDSASPAGAPATAVGKLEVSRSGSGLLVRLVNPKDGAATAHSGYAKEKAGCNGHPAPCYIFSAINGTAPMPVSADCPVDKVGDVPTAYCTASGVSSVEVEALTGGTIGYDASGTSELGKNCFPHALNYVVGPKEVYSVLAWDGCKETITCQGHNVGTVDADDKDDIKGPCYYVDRH